MLKLRFFFYILATIILCSPIGRAQNALDLGMVAFEYTMNPAPDASVGVLDVYFKKDVAAVLMGAQEAGQRKITTHSVYYFAKDSVDHCLIEDGAYQSKVSLGLSESLDMGSAGLSISPMGKTQTILGYQCAGYQGVSRDSSIRIETWVTDSIRTNGRPVLDRTLLTIGFPLKLTLFMNTPNGEQQVIFTALAVKPEAADDIFVIPGQ